MSKSGQRPFKKPDHTPCPTRKRAVQGFVVYVLSTGAFVLYLAWLLVPEQVLEDSLGITFLPQRYWAVALPIYASVAFFTFVFIVYPSLGLASTPPLQQGDLRYMTDTYSVFNEDSFLSSEEKESIAKVCDLYPSQLVSNNKKEA